MQKRSLIVSALGTAIALGLLAFALHRAGLGSLRLAVEHAGPAVLLPAVACEVVVQLSRALKWTSILRQQHPVRFGSVLGAILAGGASTHLVPLRLDEVIRAALLGRRERVPVATVLGTVALDRIFEVLVLGLLLGLVAAMTGLPDWLRLGAAAMWLGFLVACAGVLAFLRWEGALRARLDRAGWAPLRGAGPFLSGLATGLRAFPRGRRLAGAVAGAAGDWAATTALYAWLLAAFGTGAGPGVALVLAVGSAVSYAIPNLPGAVGSFETIQPALMERAAGLPPEQALAVALVAHFVLIVPITSAGLAVLGVELGRGGLRPG